MNVDSVKVLLAEDNDDFVFLFREALEETPIGSFFRLAGVVHDGVDALSYLRREGPFETAERPSLLLLDINMPRRDGFEVLREVKNDPDLRGIPVVLLTTSDRGEDIRRAYDSGAASYVVKPGAFSELRRVLASFCDYWVDVSRVPSSDRSLQ